ncbi:MAG TPA: UvrD-helicase domain-containing protein [Planctomycetota bacterium]|jgi:DNA helicase-2/ATP-dependent DNA helicase PcrA|nr:UvrD-helicase domain-containing protein [Planctomycetota bacterium]
MSEPSLFPTPGAAPAADLLEGLNAPQREAVVHGDGPLLILAGPGSGKTRVITRRIVWLVRERGVRPGEILAITFTNKAAGEMRERVLAMLPARGLWISTFHSMCARILRSEIEVLNTPAAASRGAYTRDFTIYDTCDRNELLRKLIKEANYDVTRFKPSMVGAWISAKKNQGRAEREEVALLPEGEEGIEHEVLVRVHRLYEEAMRRNNALDFDDLLVRVLEIFDDHPGVRDAYASRFRYVLVDEYQDTNRVQYLLTRHLASFHGNVTVCGDPDQSIYAWRGADIRNILDFERDFGAAKVVRLEQNYRSSGNVLAAAQSVIRHNRARREKSIWTSAEAGSRIVVLRCADENDEAREIAREIRTQVAAGRSPDEFAVFYRVNFMQRALESALRLASVPYQVVGGVEFYARREIRDLIAYLKLAVNPADEIAFRRAVNTPQRGIGEKTVDAIVRWATDRRVPVLAAVRSNEVLALARGRARAGLEAFGDLMARLEPLADAPAAVALGQLVEEIDYDAWLAQMDDESGVDRGANVEELLAHAAEYDRGAVGASSGETDAAPGGLRGFLQDVALVSDVDSIDPDAKRATLMTLHSAKGLEFPVVFIAGVEEELLPHVRAIAEVQGPDPEAGIEEERRLLYVGITRAEERLFLTHAQTRLHFGQESFRSPSRFLSELPPELVEGYEPDAEEEEMLGAFAPPAASPELRVGDRVEHDHFGRGTVERLRGSGINARATVRFVSAGERQLLLQYAKLKLVERAGS